MTGKHYPSDLTDGQWDFIKDHFVPDPKKGGRPAKHSRRRILEAALYVLKTGCQWRYLPFTRTTRRRGDAETQRSSLQVINNSRNALFEKRLAEI